MSQPLSTPPAPVKASPIARRLAQQHGIDLCALSGSGPGGRIVREDVEGALAAGGQAATATGPATPPTGAVESDARGEISHQAMTPTQRVMAKRMVESHTTVPDFTIEVEVAMEAAVTLRDQLKRSAPEPGVVPSYNDMVIRACALALREYPRVNAAVADNGYDFFGRVNIGMAVAAGDALLVPTVIDADLRTLAEVATETQALAERARNGRLAPGELSGATFTVSNLGMFGTTRFSAVINPPQVAILAVGAVRQKPVVREGAVVPGTAMSLVLSSDHRILGGAEAAQFLARVGELLETPAALL